MGNVSADNNYRKFLNETIKELINDEKDKPFLFEEYNKILEYCEKEGSITIIAVMSTSLKVDVNLTSFDEVIINREFLSNYIYDEIFILTYNPYRFHIFTKSDYDLIRPYASLYPDMKAFWFTRELLTGFKENEKVKLQYITKKKNR